MFDDPQCRYPACEGCPPTFAIAEGSQSEPRQEEAPVVPDGGNTEPDNEVTWPMDGDDEREYFHLISNVANFAQMGLKPDLDCCGN